MLQVTALVLTVLFSIPSPGDVRRAARQVIESGDFQTELPGETGYSDWTPPDWVDDSEPVPVEEDWDWTEREPVEWDAGDRGTRNTPDRTRGGGDRGGSSSSSSGDGPAVGNALLWLLLAVSVGIAAMWIARSLGGYTRDAKIKERSKAAAAPAPVEFARPKTEAERLADLGEYGEAIHVLLLETLRELARQLPGGIRKSLTSREIITRLDVPEAAAPALEGLVAAVETSLFGHHVSGVADYEACVQHFQRFAAAHAAGARA